MNEYIYSGTVFLFELINFSPLPRSLQYIPFPSLEFYFLEFLSSPKVPVVLLSSPPPPPSLLLLLYIYVYVCFYTVSAWFSTSATKKRMQNVANISILAMFVMYLLTALFGYLTFFGNFLSLTLVLIR